MAQTIESANVQLQTFVKAHIEDCGDEAFTQALGSEETSRGLDASKYFTKLSAEKRGELSSNLNSLEEDLSFKELESQINAICKSVDVYVDSRMGVVRTASKKPEIAFVGNDPDTQKSHVVTRDARLQKYYNSAVKKAEEVPEATIAIAAGNLRGVLQMIKDAEGDDASKDKAKKEAVKAFHHYRKLLVETQDITEDEKTLQEKRNLIAQQMNHEMADILVSSDLGVSGTKYAEYDKTPASRKLLYEGMGYVRDLTNLNDEPHSSVVTISSSLGSSGDWSKKHHIEATVPVKPLSEHLKTYYTDPQLVKAWATDLNPILRRSISTGEFTGKIMDGAHMLSSQLPIPGLRNAAIEHSMIVEADGQLSVTDKGKARLNDQMFRSGTPAHNHGEDAKDKQFQHMHDAISAANIRHGKTLCSGKTPEIIVLNDNIKETGIVSKAKNAAKKAGVGIKNLAISFHPNKARHLISVWENFKNKAKSAIQWISCKSGKDRTSVSILQNVLKSMKHSIFGKDKLTESEYKELAYARDRIVSAGHGSAVAANVGATVGINATKAKNVFTGLEVSRKLTIAKHTVLRFYEDQLHSKLCDLNKMEPQEPGVNASPAYIARAVARSVKEELAKAPTKAPPKKPRQGQEQASTIDRNF